VASPTVVNCIKDLTSNESLAFPYPWLLVGFTNLITCVFATASIQILPKKILPDANPDAVVPWKYAAVLGVMQGIEVGMGADILHRLSITMRTEIMMLAPAFMFVCGLLLGIESFTPTRTLATVAVTIGGMLASYGTMTWEGIELVPWAVLMCIFGALRWSLTQKWLSPNRHGKPSTVVLCARLSPFTALVGFVVSAFHNHGSYAALLSLPNPKQVALLLCLIGFGVFILIVSELRIVQLTSALLLGFFVPFHCVSLILIDVVARGTHMSQWNWLGVMLCSVATGLFAITHKGDRLKSGPSETEPLMPRPTESGPSETNPLIEAALEVTPTPDSSERTLQASEREEP
jgi:drug/metabolite transporter (DMT)-like permease